MSTEVESVPSAVDNAPMTTHQACLSCWPVFQIGMRALCGEMLLGTPAKSKANCADCLKAQTGHRLSHMGGRG